MNGPNATRFEPEVFLVFVGHSSDADKEAHAIRDLEMELRRELERLQGVASGTLAFKTVRCWEWNYDAQPMPGGQDATITPDLDRANIALFVFKERVGKVTWSELERSRRRSSPPIPVVAFFPANPPENSRMSDIVVAEAWTELLRKKRSLTEDWTVTDSRSLRPTTDYRDVEHPKEIVLEQMKNALSLVLRSTSPRVVKNVTSAVGATLLGEHPHPSYDRRPVISYRAEELDMAAVQRFLGRPLSREQLKRAGLSDEATSTDKLTALGCVCDGHPTLGAFLCFAPPLLLANESDGCSLQMVVYDRERRGSSSPSITLANGNLQMLYEEGMSWLTRGAGLRRQGHVGRGDRDELEIPEIVLREALANALVHRDYETTGLREQPTRLEVFPNRVEITSFGNLPSVVPVELLNRDTDERIAWRRNPVIARVFQHMSHVELNASGVSRMRLEMEKASLAFPKFIADLHESVVRVVLLRPPASVEEFDEARALPVPKPGQFRAMISSTVADLPEHRKQAVEACLRQGFFPTLMESPASDAAPVQTCKHIVDEADVFIGIYAWRYGFIPDGEDISIPEIEFNRAIERGIPLLVFMMHENHPVTRAMVEYGDLAQHRLAEFKERVRRSCVAADFRSPDELRGQIIEALAGVHIGARAIDGYQGAEIALRGPPLDHLPRAHAGEFLGRDTQIDDLVARLRRQENVCVWGPAGFGKTALAAEALLRVVGESRETLAKSSFPDGVVVLDLYRLKANQDQVWHLLADKFTPEIPAELPARERATRACAGRRALVVVEGAEQAQDAQTLRDLLGVLDDTTTRLILTRNRAQAFYSQPIRVDAELEANDAIALLAKLTGGRIDTHVLADVAKVLGGHPLALTWAGCQLSLREEPAARFLTEMQKEHLPTLHQPGYAGHTLKWLYDRSARMLTEDAKGVLCGAGLLAAAPFGLGAALASLDRRDEATGAEGEGRAHEALRLLVRHGLLRVAADDEELWEFSHALASRFAGAEAKAACPPLDPLYGWALTALKEGTAHVRKTGGFSPLHNALLHATALLAHDSSGDTGWPVANWLLYDGQDLFFALGRLASARDSLAAVEAWMQRMPPTRSAEPYWRRELSALLSRKGNVQLAQGDLAGARDSYQNSRTIREKLAAGDPTNAQWQRDLSVSLNKLGDVQLAQGDLAGARDSYQNSRVIAEKLAAGDPTNAQWQRDVVVSHAKLGEVAGRAGDGALAREEFAAGLTIAERLCRLDPTNATWRKDAEWLRGQIGP